MVAVDSARSKLFCRRLRSGRTQDHRADCVDAPKGPRPPDIVTRVGEHTVFDQGGRSLQLATSPNQTEAYRTDAQHQKG